MYISLFNVHNNSLEYCSIRDKESKSLKLSNLSRDIQLLELAYKPKLSGSRDYSLAIEVDIQCINTIKNVISNYIISLTLKRSSIFDSFQSMKYHVT